MDHDALARDMLNAHFRTTQLREGYAEGEVDDFIDELVAQVRAGVAPAETVRTIEGKRFSTTSFRRGYEMGDVDAFLADVRTRLATGPAADRSRPVSDQPSALIEPGPSLGARLLRALRGS